MVVGMGGLTQAGQVEKAIAVGAQFITSINLDEAIRIQCYQQNILYIPSVISIFAAQAALTTFCPFVRVITGGPQGPGYIRTMCSSLPELGIMVAGDFSLDEVKCYKDAGAIGVIIGTTLVSGPTQPMADIISRARALQQIWGVAEAQEDDKPTN